MELFLELATPRALARSWQEQLSRGRLTVPAPSTPPRAGSEVGVRLSIVGRAEPLRTRLQVTHVGPGAEGRALVRGRVRDLARVERSVLEALSRCPLLGRRVLFAGVPEALVAAFVEQGAWVCVARDAREVRRALEDDGALTTALVLDADLPGLSTVLAPGGALPVAGPPIFLVAAAGGDGVAAGRVRRLDREALPEVAVAAVRASLGGAEGPPV